MLSLYKCLWPTLAFEYHVFVFASAGFHPAQGWANDLMFLCASFHSTHISEERFTARGSPKREPYWEKALSRGQVSDAEEPKTQSIKSKNSNLSRGGSTAPHNKVFLMWCRIFNIRAGESDPDEDAATGSCSHPGCRQFDILPSRWRYRSNDSSNCIQWRWFDFLFFCNSVYTEKQSLIRASSLCSVLWSRYLWSGHDAAENKRGNKV